MLTSCVFTMYMLCFESFKYTMCFNMYTVIHLSFCNLTFHQSLICLQSILFTYDLYINTPCCSFSYICIHTYFSSSCVYNIVLCLFIASLCSALGFHLFPSSSKKYITFLSYSFFMCTYLTNKDDSGSN